MAPRAEPRPFEVAVPEEALADLRERLRRTRWAPEVANEDWSYGANGTYLRELVAYWIEEFDWRAVEARINTYANFRVELDPGVPIHFVHERGVGPRPVPLILTHGWPWTFMDFERVIRPLADPAAFGGDPADAFDVVVPSLPGFGFSSPLGVTGIGPFQTADLWVRLMRDVLGYERFAAQGGDWGAIVTAQLGHAHADSLLGVHLSLPALLGGVLGRLKAEDYGPGEEGWYERMQTRMAQTAASHLAVHRLDPQTLAWACHDSPVGLAAWILERRRNWSDCDGDVERRFSKDDLLTTISIYWLTETFVSSVRYYREALLAGWAPAHDRRPRIEAPTAIAVFPQELILVPRSVAAQESDLRRWTVMPSGGHFAPAEEPELLIEDVRASFRPLR